MKGLAKRLSLVICTAAVFAGCGNPWMKRVTASLYDKPEIPVTPEVPVQTGSDKAITAFDITSPVSATGFINEAAKTIAVIVPYSYGAAITSLTPTIKHTGVSVSPPSDTAQDFTGPVSYTVTAADGSADTYTVMVTVASTLNNIAEIGAYLSGASGGTTPGSPIVLPLLDIDLAGTGWTDLLTTIATASKYVSLDLSACTMSGTEFDPGTADTGEQYVTALTLPAATTSVKAGTISDPSFQFFDNLKSVSGTNVTSIGDYAFRLCYSLATVEFPAATTIGALAFANCITLTTVEFPMAININNYAFSGCISLTTVDLPAATSIGLGALRDCVSLITVEFPAVININSYAFSSCTSLTTVDLPAATNIGLKVFGACDSLTSVTLPETPPRVEEDMFDYVFSAITVTVKAPNIAAGYGSVPVNTTDNNWGNAFRGKGWSGSTYLAGTVNSNVTLVYQNP
jgi:hypothetical protein